ALVVAAMPRREAARPAARRPPRLRRATEVISLEGTITLEEGGRQAEELLRRYREEAGAGGG
ncbi:MAG: hypothetical protein QI223_08865, partial [Candidatus Korarchaeota archaeon]|nr:hypothetical protein [Candidatus Korarchaeota archaeon]